MEEKMDKHHLAFDADLSHRTKDENGFLRVTGNHITKETVNPYYGREVPGWREAGLDPEKIYYGYRSGEELEKGAKTFEGLPLLMGHHVESAEDPQKEYRVGSSGTDAEWNAPYVDISLFVTDADAIRAIENGKAREISCAYLYEPDFTSGEFEGQAYDFVMRNIRGNHIALVEEGRAGADVVVADAQIKPKPVRLFMKLFQKFRGALDELPESPAEKTPAQDSEKLKAMLEALKEAGKITEEELAALLAAAMDEEPEEAPAAPAAKDEEKDAETVREAVQEAVEKITGSGEEIDEAMKLKMKAAADACGLDAESPEFQKAFAEGVKYGEEKEKEEPKHLDSLHESEGAKKALDEEEVKQAMDSAIKDAAKRAHEQSVAKFRALSAAAEAVRPVLGSIDALAFDSAEDIYGAALKKSGLDPRKYPRSAWRGMFDVMSKGRGSDSVRMAQDSMIGVGKVYDGPFAGLNNIRKG